MDIVRVDFAPLDQGGDNGTAALVKLDHDVQELADAITDGDTAATALATRVSAVEDKASDLDARVTAAKTAADNAKTAADGAQTTATTANTTANTAKTNAATAQATADTANTKATAAMPKAGGTFTGAVNVTSPGNFSVANNAGPAFGTTGTANIGGSIYTDYFQCTVAAIGANVYTRMQCVDVQGGVTYTSLVTGHFDNTSATYRFQHNGIAQATTWQSTSDIRIKRNLVPLVNALDMIDQLTGYEFYEKRVSSSPLLDDEGQFVLDGEGNPKMGPAQYMATCGLIAGDVLKVLPAAIDQLGSGFDTDDQPIDDILGINDAGLSALFVEAIKELKAQNADLLARVAALEAR